jgi:hypothetical protein
MCRGLGSEFQAGSISGRHPELTSLREAAVELAQKIEQAQRDAF